MKLLEKIAHSDRLSVYSGLVFFMLLCLFAYSHFVRFRDSGDWTLLFFVAAEALTALFYLVRHTPDTVSSNPVDWITAVIGSFAPLFFRPASWGLLPEANYLIAAGVTIQILAVASLNRSFAIVAAKRTIKKDKMYRFVRHPIYASYVVTFTAYLLAHTSLANLAIYALTISFLVMRLRREEVHLAQDPSYRDYMHEVRYRVIPYVY